MIDWRLLALIVPITFVSFQSLVKLLPKGVSIFLVNAYASLLGVFIMLLLHFITQSDKSVVLSSKSLWIAVLAGTFISLGNFGIIKAYSLGAPQAVFTPIFYVTLIVYGIFFGLIFFREGLNLAQVFGIFLSVVGVAVVFYFKNTS